MKKNRIIAIILTLAMCMGILAGCGNNNISSNGNKKYSIVCTIFPEYDWVREIIGDKADNFEITWLLSNGTDLHSYQPTAKDVTKIAACDLFIYVGGESDKWAEDAIAEAINKNMQVVNLMEVLGDNIKEEELVEGMQAEDEHDHEEEQTTGAEAGTKADEEEEEIEYDEHVWLSVQNAKVIVNAISEAVQNIDSANKDVYQTNATAYSDKLTVLDTQFQSAVNNASNKAILVGDRFPFRYMVDDYGIDYYAAFVGCSAETEASFNTITFLAAKVDELGLSKVLVLENSDKKIAQTIVSNTKNKNQEILVMNSLQSTTQKDIDNGVTYLSVMEDNLKVLQETMK